MKRFLIIIGLLVTLGMILASSAPAIANSNTNAPRIKVKDSTSSNWSGYAVATDLKSPQVNSVSDVQGQWIVPAVTGPKKGSYYSSMWVGIDGYSNGTVEQIGTEQDWSNGKAKYYAWIEMYPGPAYRILASVKAGDKMKAEVKYIGNNQFILTLTDTPTRGKAWTFSTSQTLSGVKLQSAEWIMEAPWYNGVLPLANFGTATFTNCSATIDNTAGTITTWSNDPMTMIDPSGGKSTPSILSSNGNSFYVTYSSN